MKRSHFITLILGTVSGLLFSLGMCMALIPEWNAFQPGVIFGSVGLILSLITYLVWRKMERKAPIQLSRKHIGTIAISVLGSLLFGVGMCFCMIWENMVLGILIGIAGIVALLCLIPYTKGLHD